MKKLANLLFLILLLPNLSFAEGNSQKIYSIDSSQYRAIKLLYISQGYALPSTSGPWSGAELEMMLERINPSALSAGERQLYDQVAESLYEPWRVRANDLFAFSFYGDLALDLSAHTNKDDFSNPDEYALKNGMYYGDYNVQTPIISIPFETWIGNNVYGYSSLDMTSVRNTHSLTSANKTEVNEETYITSYDYSGSYFFHNIPFVYPNAFVDFNMNFPYRAFASIGGSWWNVSIGRDQLSWGPGETGNLVIGDQVKYHNNLRTTFFTPTFKYIFSISTFPHPLNYMTKDEDGTYYFTPAYNQNVATKGLKAFIAHRLEWRIGDRINMALSEGIMYQSEDGSIDLSILSPTAIFHNFYIRGNSNSILSLEVDYALAKHWNIYGEIALDDIEMIGEYNADGSAPSALGYIAGAKFSYPTRGGAFYGFIEVAKTDPFLYLRDNGSNDSSSYGNSFIIAFPEFASDASDGTGNTGSYTLQSLGYRYSGDALVADICLGYEAYDDWYAEGNIMYMAHGTFDLLTRWTKMKSPSTPTTSEVPGSYALYETYKNAVAHYLIFTLENGWNAFGNFSIYTRTDYITVWNKGNEKGNFAQDFQFTLGFRYTI